MSDNESVASAAQDQWVDICQAIRVQLAKKVEQIVGMSAGDISSLMTAIDSAMWNEVKASSFDEGVESRRQALIREGQYGS